MAKQKRITLQMMRKYDMAHGESLVREIEMLQESVPQPTMYTVQFWNDVGLYGLQEAYLYLKNLPDARKTSDVYESRMEMLKTRIDEVCNIVLNNIPPAPDGERMNDLSS